jgi:hypothetical protein
METGDLLHTAGADLLDVEETDPARYRFRFGESLGTFTVDRSAGVPAGRLRVSAAMPAGTPDSVHKLVAALPRRLVGEAGSVGDDEGHRAFAEATFPFQGDDVAGFTRQLDQLAGSAQYLSTVPELELVTGREALTDMWSTLGAAGLAAPPVPDDCTETVTRFSDWWWGSVLSLPVEMYQLWLVDNMLDGWDGEPLFAMCYTGYGFNSYALNVAVAAGPVACFVQHEFGGVFSDPIRDRHEIASTYSRLYEVLAAAQEEPGPARWMLVLSSFRCHYQVIDLDAWRSSSPEVRRDHPGKAGATECADESAAWSTLVSHLPSDAFETSVRIGW